MSFNAARMYLSAYTSGIVYDGNLNSSNSASRLEMSAVVIFDKE
jgi:hypothetical protein